MAHDRPLADAFVALGVVALLVGRFAWAGTDGDLEPSFVASIACAAGFFAAAVTWSSRLGGAVRALLAAIALFTLSLDPTTGWDERNFAYGAVGAIFAAVALVLANRFLAASRMPGPAPAATRVAAVATWTSAALMLAGVTAFIGVVLAVFWALSRGGGS